MSDWREGRGAVDEGGGEREEEGEGEAEKQRWAAEAAKVEVRWSVREWGSIALLYVALDGGVSEVEAGEAVR